MDSLTKPFTVDATTELKLRMLIASTLSDSRVFRSQIESIYPRLKGDYAFDCASARCCGNHPTISRDLDANHSKYKEKLIFWFLRKLCLTVNQYCFWSSLLHARPLCTRMPYAQLGKGAVAFSLNVSFSVVSKTNYLHDQIPGEQENTCSSLFSVLFIWCLRNSICMWMSAHSAVTFRLSHCN